MKKSIITVTIILLLMLFFNHENLLPRMTEITLMEPVYTIGVDKNDGFTKLSFIIEKIEDSDEGEEGGGGERVVEITEASSAPAALEALRKQFPREIAIGSAGYFLIGEKAAENVYESIDYLSKDNMLRLTANIFFVRGTAFEANEVLTNEKSIDTLRNFGENSGISAFSCEMHFYEFLGALAKPDSAIAAPALRSIKQGDKTLVYPEGYALIKNGNLIGWLDSQASRSYNIIQNKSVRSAVEIPDTGAAVIIETSSCSFDFKFDENGLPEITVEVNIFTSAVDTGNLPDIRTEGVISQIEKIQGEIMRKELIEVINISKELKCDFLGFGDALKMKHPYKWEKLKDNWDEIYFNAPVSLKINSSLSRNFDIGTLKD